ncbi:spore protease YyaC [Aquibacillus koreensis]|uniref:Spore protease YyaC n=1 Tax=Aquibacillus koreensis TaxID=279446 RepID=A0A9X3WQB0_9BACI|nr:spore protease YyaC [Aquibacillus koreensis]MCT2536414.1 spore protease YyaC [Aquibacillus koreensis]MDC3422763.1 spore protease YyaC [Aquibacillus koreensis]
MNLKDNFTSKNEIRHFFDHPLATLQLSKALLEWIPNEKEIIVLCIGTDRSTGDSLGPLVGTLLSEKKPKHLSIYGTLDQPVHAINLKEKIEMINANHQNPYVIALDACLGKLKSIGSIITAPSPIQPGAALKKDLPDVGDAHITGVVNISGFMEFQVLQNTRLHIVMQMARTITGTLYKVDREISFLKTNTMLNTKKSLL